MKKKKFNYKNFIVQSAFYTTGSIMGPLLVFAGIGYYLDRSADKDFPLYTLIGVFIAFIFTNILLFKKIKFMMAKIDIEAKKATKSTKKSLKNK